MVQPILIPVINPNEPDALLAAVYVTEGQRVERAQPLFTLETTKSTAEVAAEASGFVLGIRYAAGQTIPGGQPFAFLADTPDWTPPAEPPPASSTATGAEIPPGLRITAPALALARRRGLPLASLPTERLVTERIVQAALEAASTRDTARFSPESILIYGAGGHGKMVIDLLRGLKTYAIAGIIDDRRPAGELVMGVPVLGSREILSGLQAQGLLQAVNAVGGIGNIQVRIRVFEALEQAGYAFPTLVHPGAICEPSATLEPGAQVFARAYVGSEARVGFGVIVNTGAIVSHDCRLEAYSILSPGAILAGEVTLGSGALVGMGATVNLGVQIGARARVGNSATVKQNVPEGGIVRAGTIWPA